MENQIRFDHITKKYPGASTPAVSNVSFEVEAGSFVVIVGPSGCGKTTLLKMVNRLVEPTSGTIRLDNLDVREIPLTSLRRRMGYVIQQVGLFPHMTVAQNIAVVPELLHWPRAQIDTRIDELLELVHLPASSYRARYPAHLSGGEQQRVGLARALAANPTVLLMDEPFGAIDAITRQALQGEMLELHKRLRKTILFVTHDVDEALRLADCIAVMRGGHLEQYDPPHRLLMQPVNDFVAELTGAEDAVRQLSVVKVREVMRGLDEATRPGSKPIIEADSTLRQAFSQLLNTGEDSLVVVNEGRPVGSMDLSDIYQALAQHRTHSW